jgi:hypothetical protein
MFSLRLLFHPPVTVDKLRLEFFEGTNEFCEDTNKESRDVHEHIGVDDVLDVLLGVLSVVPFDSSSVKEKPENVT